MQQRLLRSFTFSAILAAAVPATAQTEHLADTTVDSRRALDLRVVVDASPTRAGVSLSGTF